jgi:hypothetical protein
LTLPGLCFQHTGLSLPNRSLIDLESSIWRESHQGARPMEGFLHVGPAKRTVLFILF